MNLDCSKLFEGTKGQQTRNFLRKNVFGTTEWHVFIAILFTLLHDLGGLVSASSTVIYRLPFDSTALKLAIVYVPIIVFDCGSELMFVYYHDIPLCKGKFKNGVTDRNRLLIKIALVGQILTAICWGILFGFIVYFAVFTICPVDPKDLAKCEAFLPGFTEGFVILIVLLKNSMTLKEYNDRVFIYPIICKEHLLFLHHIQNKESAEIVNSFQKYHALENEDPVNMPFTSRMEFNIAINYILMVFFDIAGLASVSTIIVVHGASVVATAFRAIPFAIVLVVDILSETLILIYHDLPLIRAQPGEQPKKYKRILDFSKGAQVFVNLAWLGSLIYMIFIVSSPHCLAAECNCLHCTFDGSYCDNSTSWDGYCKFYNHTYSPLSPSEVQFSDSVFLNLDPFGEPKTHFSSNFSISNYSDLTSFACNATYTEHKCESDNPSLSSCVLLFLVLLDSFYAMGQLFFRTYIFPLTVPEDVMFLHHFSWNKGEIIESIYRNEFGVDDDLPDHVSEAVKYYKNQPDKVPEEDVHYVPLDEENNAVIG